MNMQMGDGLPSSSAVIDADVVPIRGELSIEHCLRSVQQSQKIIALFCRQIKKGPSVASWNDQRMSGRNWVGIPDDKTVLAAVDHPRWWQSAEGAGLGGGHGKRLKDGDRVRLA